MCVILSLKRKGVGQEAGNAQRWGLADNVLRAWTWFFGNRQPLKDLKQGTDSFC